MIPMIFSSSSSSSIRMKQFHCTNKSQNSVNNRKIPLNTSLKHNNYNFKWNVYINDKRKYCTNNNNNNQINDNTSHPTTPLFDETEDVPEFFLENTADKIPSEIVKELDKFIVGQTEAKKSIAVSFRNRWRRKNLPNEIKEEVMPKNILMVGPTGVGKTEIARRLAKISGAPFVKVEATKYTEVGYKGKDVDTIIEDLLQNSIQLCKRNHLLEQRLKIEQIVEDRLVNLIMENKTFMTMIRKTWKSNFGMDVSLIDGNEVDKTTHDSDNDRRSNHNNGEKEELVNVMNSENYSSVEELHPSTHDHYHHDINNINNDLAINFTHNNNDNDNNNNDKIERYRHRHLERMEAAIQGESTLNKYARDHNYNNSDPQLQEEEEKIKKDYMKDRSMLLHLLHYRQLDDKILEFEAATTYVTPKQFMITSQIKSDSNVKIGLNLNDVVLSFQSKFGRGGIQIVKKSIKDMREMFMKEEEEKIQSNSDLVSKAIRLAEEEGIVFIDEIDKICQRPDGDKGNSTCSDEGVQRDLLPLIEGSIVSTKYGDVKTDKILFIAAGAFYSVKPSDIIPELQGRLPIRVELQALKEADFVRILTEPSFNLINQQIELLKSENISIEVTPDAIQKIAHHTQLLNTFTLNIGARRLNTVIEKLFEDISFNCDEYENKTVIIDANIVDEKLKPITGTHHDLRKFVI